MEHIDRKYALLLSNRLRNWKVQDSKFNFSCPYCGDSTRNKFKARGYLLPKKGSLFFYCHNCGKSNDFKGFLYDQDVSLYREYRLEKLGDHDRILDVHADLAKPKPISSSTEQTSSVPGPGQKNSPLSKLKKVSQLNWDHPVKQYITKRMIPNPYHAKLYYCQKFQSWVNTLIPGKFGKDNKDEPRLIIPLLDKKGRMFGFQGRSLSPESTLRYITIMLGPHPKLFGLDEVKESKLVYVMEGPFDSMFIHNAIALAGSDGHLTFDNYVMVYDNEPRSVQIVRKMDKSIGMNRKIVVWPSLLEHKDVNDMVMSGMRIADIKMIIDENTYEGLSAKMVLQHWQKI